jgi:hypothetical protein
MSQKKTFPSLEGFLKAAGRLLASSVMIVTFTTSQTLTWIQPEEAEAQANPMDGVGAEQQCDALFAQTIVGAGQGDLDYAWWHQDVNNVNQNNIPALSAKAIFNYCGKPKDIDMQGKIPQELRADEMNETEDPAFPDFNTCKAGKIAQWRTVAPHCVVLKKVDISRTWQIIAVIAYWAAAAVCWVAFGIAAADITGAGAEAMKWICFGVGIAGAALDAGGLIHLASENGAGGVDGSSVATTIFGGLGAISSSLLSSIEFLGQSAAFWIGIAAGLFTAVAIIKTISLIAMDSTKEKSAQEIAKLASDFTAGAYLPGGIPSAPPAGGAKLSSGGGFGGGSVTTGSSGGSGGKGGGALPKGVSDALSSSDNLQSSFAAAAQLRSDPITQKLEKNFKGQKLTDSAKDLLNKGADLKSAATAGLGAGSLKSFMSAAGGPLAEASSKFGGAIGEVEESVRNGKFAKSEFASLMLGKDLMAQVQSAGNAGAGKGAPAGSSPFGGMFGAKAPAGDAKAIESFGATQKKDPLADLPESTDIWHGGDGRTIFQIVSRRIDKARDRTHTLDWESKLNRAIHGALKTSAAGHSSDTKAKDKKTSASPSSQ